MVILYIEIIWLIIYLLQNLLDTKNIFSTFCMSGLYHNQGWYFKAR